MIVYTAAPPNKKKLFSFIAFYFITFYMSPRTVLIHTVRVGWSHRAFHARASWKSVNEQYFERNFFAQRIIKILTMLPSRRVQGWFFFPYKYIFDGFHVGRRLEMFQRRESKENQNVCTSASQKTSFTFLFFSSREINFLWCWIRRRMRAGRVNVFI